MSFQTISPYLKILDFEYFAIDKTFSMLLWFYLGMVMQLENLSNKLKSWKAVVVWGIIYTLLLYFISVPVIGNLVCALTGILFIFSLSHKFADFLPTLFGSWRNYTYQIYLMHMYPIMVFKYLYKTHLFSNDDIWLTCIWVCSLICSIALPTLVAKIAERMPHKIKMLIGL